MRARLALILALAALAGVPTAAAADGVFGLVVENDNFAGSDDGYTNGLKLYHVSAEGRGARLGRFLLGAGDSDRVRFGVAAGQSIFTPDDTFAVGPLPDQRPYAGWLYLEAASIVERQSGAIDILKIAAGVVGPWALAEEAQRTAHRFSGANDVFGWDNQLPNEPGLVVSYDRLWRPFAAPAGVGLDALPYAGASVGNVLTEARAGAILRIGSKLGGSPPPARIAPSVPSAGYFADGVSWQVFAGAGGRAVARNIFLDGASFRDSLSVEKNTLVGEVEAGFSVSFGAAAIGYTHVIRTKEFETQQGRSVFGAVTLSATF